MSAGAGNDRCLFTDSYATTRRSSDLTTPAIRCIAKALFGAGVGAKLGGMTLKERIHHLVDSMSEDDDRLHAAEQVLEPNGAVKLKLESEPLGAGGSDADDQPVDEHSRPTFEQRLDILANFDLLPREDAWT